MTPRPWMTVRRLPLPDLLRHLGGIAPERVCLDPPPGTATEAHVDDFDVHHDRLFELIDGVLVEKVYNARDSMLGVRIGCELGNWEDRREYGAITGAAGPFKFGPRQVRMPDVALTSWDRLPNGIPRKPVPDLVPNVAVEVVNPANTPGEMARKLADYRAAGVELIWYVYPDRREVEVFTPGPGGVTLTAADTLRGGKVLPGFALPVADIFRSRAPAKKPGRRGRN